MTVWRRAMVKGERVSFSFLPWIMGHQLYFQRCTHRTNGWTLYTHSGCGLNVYFISSHRYHSSQRESWVHSRLKAQNHRDGKQDKEPNHAFPTWSGIMANQSLNLETMKDLPKEECDNRQGFSWVGIVTDPLKRGCLHRECTYNWQETLSSPSCCPEH